MAARRQNFVLCLLVASLVSVQAVSNRGAAGSAREQSLLQTWGAALDTTGSKASTNPVQRVVKLLNEMQATLKKEMDEDEALFCKLKKWCNGNSYEKTEAIEAGQAKIAELEASIEELTGKSASLKEKIKELETEVAADKKALAEATAIREKEASEFQGSENDDVQSIEQLKAAITVLSKHHGGPPPAEFLAIVSGQQTSSSPGFLQQDNSGWSISDLAVLRRAAKSASSFLQAHHEEGYYPSYASQSSEILGILKQMKEEMEKDLSEAQKQETEAAVKFAALRDAKESEISQGEKMAEKKEDELAQTDNALAEAKEDLEQENAKLDENVKFMNNLNTTCETAEEDFDARKNARMTEIQAVSETIGILTADEARDTFSSTYSLVQLTRRQTRAEKGKRRAAALALRKAGAEFSNPAFSALATSVELDSFTKVKEAIDKMVAMLKQQQDDEVKKNDWCKASLQENEMNTAKTTDLIADLEAKIGKLTSDIEKLTSEIEAAKEQIDSLQVALQQASEDRKVANLEYQKTVADQAATKEILRKALERLAKFYDEEALLQSKAGQTPPVAQMTYEKNTGSTGVMSMLEKLIGEAADMVKDSKKEESDAQAAYETLVSDTNASIAALMDEITSKTKAKAKAGKTKVATAEDLADANVELEELGKYNADLHTECDYLLKNFDVRQVGRAQEIEALQQAKSILSGADMS
mmetsp:Transcript_70521/g.131908  ORF Transcript_70521/g.131908 Transcript_70521/m.131908 type:complete len:702 (+) Transcript_70521:85-2190(+)